MTHSKIESLLKMQGAPENKENCFLKKNSVKKGCTKGQSPLASCKEEYNRANLEERLSSLESKIDRILSMVESIYKHVGFVDQLSNVFERIKTRGVGAAAYAIKFLQ